MKYSEWWQTGFWTTSLEIYIATLFLKISNTGPDPLDNHETTKPAFNVWPPPAHMHFAGGPVIGRF